MKVAVLGAGIAGAAAAHTLTAAGAEVVVLEASAAVGGRTETVRREGFLVDTGAIFVMGSYDRTLHYLKESGHEREMTRWAARTAILHDEVRHPVRLDQPASFLRLPQLTWADRLGLVRALVAGMATRGPAPFGLESLAEADDGETLEQWGRRVVGDRVYEFMIRPLMEPLTGAELGTISPSFTRALLRRPLRTALTVPKEGLGSLSRWLTKDVDVMTSTPAQALKETADGWEVSTPTGPIRSDAVIVATDSTVAGALLDGVAPSAATVPLAGITRVRTHHVWLGYRKDPWPDAAVDLVVPVGAGPHRDFGVLLNGRRAPYSTPDGGQSVSVYLDDRHGPTLTADELREIAVESVRRAFGPAEPDLHEVFTLDHGLVAPKPGHYRSMMAALAALPPNLRLAGDYLTHSGIEGALISGERAARDLLTGA